MLKKFFKKGAKKEEEKEEVAEKKEEKTEKEEVVEKDEKVEVKETEKKEETNKKEDKSQKEEKEQGETETKKKKENKGPVLGGISPCGHSYSQYPQEFLDSKEPCLFGIDEAGRGPVLGPMVYACAFWPLRLEKELKQMKFDDSKALKEEVRENLFDLVVQNGVGYHVKSLSPQFISQSMLRLAKYNLNEISHDTATDLIQDVLDSGVNVTHVYVDTVGDSSYYERKLSYRFPSLTIKVSKKADSIYPIVSAASICAKVIRDGEMKSWTFEEKSFSTPSTSPSLSPSSTPPSPTTLAFLQKEQKKRTTTGSGYPADPITKKWMKDNCDSVFGFPSIVRFSWKTVSNILKTDGVVVKWGDEEEEENGRAYKRIKRSNSEGAFGSKKGKKFNEFSTLSASFQVQKMFSTSVVEGNTGGEGGEGGRKRKRGARDRYFVERGMNFVSDL